MKSTVHAVEKNMKYVDSMRQVAVSSCVLFAKIPGLNVKRGMFGIFFFL